MLTTLSVRHLAVVDELELDLDVGLTVVTGETGAGKSLLVDALLLLLGARADANLVRAGSQRAEAAAGFSLDQIPAASQWLRDQDLDEDEAGSCQLRRVVRADGGSRAWINGHPATASQLDTLGSLLIQIHGQHEHQQLLSRAHQLRLLDAFAANSATLDALREGVDELRANAARISALGGGEGRNERLELLRHEVTELERWALAPEALAELEAEHKVLANAEQLIETSRGALERLAGDDELAVRPALAQVDVQLAQAVELDARIQPVVDLLQTAGIQIDEAAAALERYAQDVDLDPQRFADIDAQLTHLHDLARRHRVPVTELKDTAIRLRTELDELENADATLAELASQGQRLRTGYDELATQLTTARTRAAERLGGAVTTLMQELGMAGGQFKAALEPASSTAPDPQGRERCEFLVSANPGQPPRPLRKVASGGELARISLALEVATLDLNATATLVFDEVDSGIGGAIAEIVGRKLRALGAKRQVLCVTHLPQVAAQGHHHLLVSKHSATDSTVTSVVALDAQARRDELARMLGGVELTPETHQHASKMLDQAQRPPTKHARKGS